MKVTFDKINNLKTALDQFQKNVEKDLIEIRSYKEEVQHMQNTILSNLNKVHYVRDEHKIILSAPEIVIGNVDQHGVLLSNGGKAKVTIRANAVDIEGTGSGSGNGSIVQRASSIRQIAVDPGIDGQENVVQKNSEIVSLGRMVVLTSEESEGFFSSSTAGGGSGIYLNSDSQVRVNALKSNKKLQENLESTEKELKQRIKNLEKESTNLKQSVSSSIKELQKIVDDDEMYKNLLSIRSSISDIDDQHEDFAHKASLLYSVMSSYFSCLSRLAEANRQLKCIQDQKEAVSKKKASFKDKTTGTSIHLSAEMLSLFSIDGDGNFRENDEAGLSIYSKKTQVTSFDKKGSLMKNSSITLASEQVEIDTSDPKISEKNTDYTAVGKVHVVSKNIQLEAIDYEQKDNSKKDKDKKALTKDGSFEVRAENISLHAIDTEGKSVGQIEANAKDLEFKSMDVDKEKGTDKSLTTGSSMVLLADKILAGSKDKKNKGKLLQIASDKVGVFGETTLELQQKKAVVQLDGGDVSLAGGKATFYGDTTLQGKVVFKSDVTAGTVEMQNLKVKTSFKTPYTSEGMAVPGAPSAAKLNPKMEEEEKKSEK